jgi:hypothetical protein
MCCGKEPERANKNNSSTPTFDTLPSRRRAKGVGKRRAKNKNPAKD